MKKLFFKEMLSDLETTSDVEVLTEDNMSSLKGGGCTCKRGGYTNNCGTYTSSDDDSAKVVIRVPSSPKDFIAFP